MSASDLIAWGLHLVASHLGSMPNRFNHSLSAARAVQAVGGTGEISGCHLAMAALVHDIGYGPALHRTGMHAIDGALHLQSLGVPNRVVGLVAFHTGAEFEADERGLARELSAFDRPPQELLDRLILADLTSSPTGGEISVEERLAEIYDRYPAEHPVHRSVTRAHEYLRSAASRAQAASVYPR